MASNELLIPVNGGDEKTRPYISLRVAYSKGGMNYASYKTERRGIYISASPVKIEDTNVPGLVMRSFMAFTGVRQLLEETKRDSSKRTATLFTETLEDFKARRGQAWTLVSHVLERNGLTMKDC